MTRSAENVFNAQWPLNGSEQLILGTCFVLWAQAIMHYKGNM